MIKIEVTGKNETKRSKGGNDYTVQEAYVQIPSSRYPVKMEVFAPKDGPYAPGEYTLSPESFLVGMYDKLEIKPVLVPLQKKAA